MVAEEIREIQTGAEKVAGKWPENYDPPTAVRFRSVAKTSGPGRVKSDRRLLDEEGVSGKEERVEVRALLRAFAGEE